MKTSELTGAALDWAVAKCEGVSFVRLETDFTPDGRTFQRGTAQEAGPNYSTDWAQGGPIIERIKGFQFKQWLESHPEYCCEAHIHNYEGDWIQFGPTPLIAAMRCYVASKLGDTVDVPGELTP